MNSDEIDAVQANLALLVEYHENMREPLGAVKFYDMLAGKLSRLAGRDEPWTWRYVQGVHKGSIAPSPSFARAVNAFGMVIDDTPPVLAYSVEVKVYARPGTLPPFGALVLAEARPCAWPGCKVIFVPRTPNQRYCSRKLHIQAKRGKI